LDIYKRDFGDDWIHIDGDAENFDHIDHHDITKLKFGSDTVDLIYASHVISYFDATEVLDVLQEWKRVLKPGGILRLAVPDFRAIAKLYYIQGHMLDRFIGPLYGKMQMYSKTIYHKMVYDEESLRYLLLTDLQFKSCDLWNWQDVSHGHFDDHSQAYLPHMDKERGTLISLNIEAIK
jgi:predicted SAM-dependent methyltransferase